jgi:undecaprenyl-diphosphatase
MRLVTHVGGVPAMTALAILGGIVLFLRGQHALALGWLIAAAGGGLMNYSVKNWIGRPRPGEELRDSAVTERNESYPSGHSMGSTVGLGSLAYVLGVHLRRRSVRALVVVTLALLIAVIGFSRMYLRAHWFSDVLGGFGLGAFWLALCLTCLELWRRRR